MADYRDYAREEAQYKRRKELLNQRIEELTEHFLNNGFDAKQARALGSMFAKHEKSRSHRW